MKKLFVLLMTMSMLFVSSTFAYLGGRPTNPVDSTGWFNYNLQPGDSIQDSITVTNRYTTPVDAAIYAADYFPSAIGGFGLKLETAEMTGLGSWVQLAQSKVRLKPGESVVIPFKMTVPKDVAPEDMIGGIVVAKKTLRKRWGYWFVRLSTRMAVRVYGNPAALPPEFQ